MKPIDCYDLYRDGGHYDLHTKLVDDIPFYLKQIRRYGDPVLELMSGTGRITIPIREKGFTIKGLDVSEPMLTVAREKSRTARLHIEWIHADCREFHVGKRFNLIFIPVNSIAHLHDLESIEACFCRVKEHLTDEGRFIIDIFTPNIQILIRDPNQRYPVAEYPDPDGQGLVRVTENNVYDNAAQINHIKWYYKIGDNDEFHVENNMRIFFPQELDALLHYNGFAIEAKYGNYDESQYESESPKQLVVCRKR
jgi:SAM-dependent methyltransferase